MKSFLTGTFIFISNIILAQSVWIDVQKFGATGNGRTDDSKAFQQAMDYCSSNNVGLKLSSGDYLLTAQLVARAPISIKGDKKTQLIADNKVPNTLFYFTDKASNVNLSNLIFNTVNNNRTPELIRFHKINKVNISGCSFLGLLPLGFNEVSQIVLSGNYFRSNSKNPSGTCNFIASSNIVISNNIFDGASGVQFIKHCSYIKVINNKFFNIRNYPIHFDGQNSIPHKFVIIKDNELKGSGEMALKGGTYDQVSCFKVEQVQIINNKIELSGDMGITLAHCLNVYVANNTINNNCTSAISIINTANTIIEYNIMKDNGVRPIPNGIDPKARAGIYFYGGDTDSILISNNKISFSNAKWKYYTVAVTTPNEKKPKVFFQKADSFSYAEPYLPKRISKNGYDFWKKSLLSKIRF